MQNWLASETLCFSKNQTMDEVSKKKIVSVNFSCVMFSLLDFLTLYGTNRLTRNVGKELPLYSM